MKRQKQKLKMIDRMKLKKRVVCTDAFLEESLENNIRLVDTQSYVEEQEKKIKEKKIGRLELKFKKA